jgi:cellulose synthase/poly-beta-1,6-N-acetylglucosamine synthase-like glycosyltransferase
MSGFTRGRDIVLGYSPYRNKKSLFGGILRFDSFFIGIQYLSFAIAGNAYMAVGRNLAYKKSLFIDNKGFQSHYKIASGDDDLFINQVAGRKNIAVQYDPDAHMITEPVKTFAQFIRQKKRHLATGKFYKISNKILLGLNISSNFVFYTLFVLLLFISNQYVYLTALLVLRVVSQMIIIKKSMHKLNEKDLLLISPLYEVLLLLFNILISVSNIFTRQHKWK